MIPWRPFVCACSIAATAILHAQQLQYQIPTTPPPLLTNHVAMSPFVDYDGDGVREYLGLVIIEPGELWEQAALQMRSGLDGSVLWQIANYAIVAPSWPQHAGDVDGDGHPDIAMLRFTGPFRSLEILSPYTNQVLWNVWGPFSALFGDAILGDVDTDGDGRSDIVTITSHSSASDVYVYDSFGALRYTIPCLSQNRFAVSLAALPDLDGDGCDEFVVGCSDATTRGQLLVVSGQTGSILRTSYGLAPGDQISGHASNTGDMDGDGVDDYAGFAGLGATGWTGVVFSGATGAMVRTFPEVASSVVTGLDFDLDGVPDIAMGADWVLSSFPLVAGSTHVYSGRDGGLLWKVDNFQAPPGTGNNGSGGWMKFSAPIGVLPGSPYPAFAWMDTQWWQVNTLHGRIRAYRATRAGQGPVTGTACTSQGSPPQIGTRVTTSGCRVTIARAASGAAAWLNLGLAADTTFAGLSLPVDLAPSGLPGCELSVGPLASYFRMLGTTGIDRGYGAVDFPFHLTTATSGLRIAAQWLVLDPATLDFATTQRHEILAQ